MVTRESLLENFEGLGIEPSDRILDKCIEICANYSIHDPEMFVDQWMSYTLSYLNNEAPTIASLEEMARKEFTKKTFPMPNDLDKDLDHYDTGIIEDEIEASIMESYNICTTPKAKKLLSRAVAMSPTCYSPFTPSAKKSSQTQDELSASGKVICTFGKPHFFDNSFNNTNKFDLNICEISLNGCGDNRFSSNDKFLYDKFSDKCAVESLKFDMVGQKICDKYFKSERANRTSTITAMDSDAATQSENSLYMYDELSKLDAPSPKQIFCIGRIASDSDSKLTENSTILISNDKNKICSQRIDFTNIPSFSIFPGQIVLTRGMLPRIENFYVHEIVSEIELDMPKDEFVELITQPISIIITSGPFTEIENVDYNPMRSLIDYCVKHKPTILILIGPFFDTDNQMVLEGFANDDFNEVFNKMISDLSNSIGLDTQILVVSSYRDVRSFVFPTHPYESIKSLPNVTMLPDPCMVDVNGFKIGITSVDVVYHLLNEELVRNPREDKIKRSIKYLLNQQSFYPLNPPNIDVPYDTTLAMKYSSLPLTPNVLILPSEDLKCYARDIHNCLAINPGRLVSNDGGTFAKFTIAPIANKTDKISDYTACQIIRI